MGERGGVRLPSHAAVSTQEALSELVVDRERALWFPVYFLRCISLQQDREFLGGWHGDED